MAADGQTSCVADCGSSCILSRVVVVYDMDTDSKKTTIDRAFTHMNLLIVLVPKGKTFDRNQNWYKFYHQLQWENPCTFILHSHMSTLLLVSEKCLDKLGQSCFTTDNLWRHRLYCGKMYGAAIPVSMLLAFSVSISNCCCGEWYIYIHGTEI